jgi:hypothetical protein
MFGDPTYKETNDVARLKVPVTEADSLEFLWFSPKLITVSF